MNESKILAAFSHFSFFFAPFIFPLIVWALTGRGTLNHREAGLAVKLHLLPLVLTIVALVAIGGVGVISNNAQVTGLASMPLLVVAGLVDLVVAIYSLYRGIKILVA